jgi:hypothetical protein
VCACIIMRFLLYIVSRNAPFMEKEVFKAMTQMKALGPDGLRWNYIGGVVGLLRET